LLNHNPTPYRQKEAGSLFTASIAQAKNHPAPLTGLGRIALETGNPKQAVDYFEKAVVLAPGDASLWYKLGSAYDRLGNRERAESCRAAFKDIDGYNADLSHTEELARTNLKDSALRLKLARLYARGAQNAKAINQYQMCLHLDPNAPGVQKELAALIAKLKAEGHMPQMTTFNGMVIASVPNRAAGAKQ
jgi:Flp pilus assembly protein TadD